MRDERVNWKFANILYYRLSGVCRKIIGVDEALRVSVCRQSGGENAKLRPNGARELYLRGIRGYQ